MKSKILKEWIFLRIKKSAWENFLWYWLPIAILLTGIRIYKITFTFLNFYSMHEWSVLPIIRNWILILISISAIILIFKKYQFRLKNKKRFAQILFILIVIALVLKGIHHLLNHTLSEYFHSYAIQYLIENARFIWELFRWDIAFLLGYGGVLVLTFQIIPNWMEKYIHVIFTGVFLVLSSLACAEFAYYIITGENGNGFLLQYIFSHFSEIAFILVSVFSNIKVMLIVFPFLLVLIPTWIRIRFNRNTARLKLDHSKEIYSKPMGMVWLILGLAFLAPSDLLPMPYREITDDVYYTVVHDLTHNPFWAIEPKLNAISPPDEKTSDTRNLKFVTTRKTPKLNIVIFMLESTRNISVTPYNQSLQSTPFLDSISKAGLLVKNMYAVMPRTSGAWIAIIDGMVPPVNSVSQSWVELEKGHPPAQSLPMLLRPFGYESGFITSERLDFQNDRQWVKNAKFDFYKGDEDLDHTGIQKTNIFGHEDKAVIAPSLAWIDSVQKINKPFFLAYMTMSGHYPYGTPTNFARKVFSPNNKELDNYLNSLLYVDQCMQALFQEYSKRGMMANTLFIILGDHGESFGEHGPRQHAGVPYDESLKIPCILYCPSLWKEAKVIDGLRQQIDILPTIADVLGYKVDGGLIPGKSLLQPVSNDRPIFFSSVDDNIFLDVRKGPLKHIYLFQKNPMEIYDLEKDPKEQNNIADQYSQAYKDSVELELYRWRKDVNASLFLGAQNKDVASKPN